MRNKFIIPALLLCCFCSAFAQSGNNVPFSELDKEVKAQQGGWNGSKQPLASLFNKERERLGKDFEVELLKYIGTDIEKHYWISSFLVEPSYLQGNKPLPKLSLLIKNNALTLLRGKEDKESLGYVVSISVTAAVLSESMELHSLAIAYKADAEKLLSKDKDFIAWFPAMDEKERKLYDSIGADFIGGVSSAAISDSEQGPKAEVIGGILNGKAIKLPKPKYSQVDASGTVTVKIVFDETGKVIWAKAVSGPTPLRESAEQAARQAEFKPVTLSGKPIKVSGVLLYNFVR